jgi:hypothetical protein
LTFFLKAHVSAGAFIALLVAPTALAHPTDIFGPDVRVEGQSVTSAVAFTITISPSYSTPKPGVTVTMTNCKSGQRAPIRLVRRIGTLGPNQSLRARPGKLVWNLSSVPAKPAKPTLRLRLAIPKGVNTFCTFTSVYDTFTKDTVNITTRVPL